jgi:DNA-binding NarL/FixJ family response regulator
LRVVIVDDSPDIRAGLRGIVEGLGAEVVGEADDGRSGIERACSLHPDILLLDVSMPGISGFDTARELRHTIPDLRIIFVSQHTTRMYADEALQIGASAYVLKRNAGSELATALDAAVSGHTFVSPGTAPPRSGRMSI